jgi:hypothetical protein
MKGYSTLIIILAIVQGCTSSPRQYEWDENASNAKNISISAGIDDSKDYKLGRDNISPNMTKNAIDIASIYSGYMTLPAGMSQLSNLQLGVASFLFSPDARSARNSFFYWDGKSKDKDEFYSNFIATMEAAKNDYIKSGGNYKVKSSFRAEERKTAFVTLKPYWTISLNGPGCKTESTKWGCAIGFNLSDIRISFPPKGSEAVLHTDVSDSHSYTKYKICLKNEEESKFECSYLHRGKVNSGFDELRFLVEFSRFLPKDFYIYAAPKKIFFGKNKPLKIPVLISRGEPMYYIK